MLTSSFSDVIILALSAASAIEYLLCCGSRNDYLDVNSRFFYALNESGVVVSP